jgi:hypothetical protein
MGSLKRKRMLGSFAEGRDGKKERGFGKLRELRFG